jgi:flagellar hook-associated protein 1 FlgK
MSLGSITQSAASGLAAAQLGISTVSNNISNVNTPGYVRETVNQTSLALDGTGYGVATAGVTRAADQFLQNASLSAAADAGSATAISTSLDQAQSLLGDPSSTSGYFSEFNAVLGDMAQLANDPASAVNSTQAVEQVGQFLGQSQTIGQTLGQLTNQADNQISGDVTQVNTLLGEINDLNYSINQTASTGGDVSGAQNAQSALINQISSLMDVKVSSTPLGGVNILTSSGQTLVNSQGAATVTYQSGSSAASQLTISQPGGGAASSPLSLNSGEINGLMSLRNTTLPNLQSQFSEYVSQSVNALNAAHNASSAVPAPATLTGQSVGTDLPTAVSGFTGTTNVCIVGSNGQLQTQVQIDFDTGTMTVGGASSSFTPATFLSTLNAALGSAGSASFSNGVLSISASAPGTGVAIAEDGSTPSSSGGRAFSDFFGLNNLISSSAPTNYQTGLNAADASPFTSGGTLTLRVSGANGGKIADIAVTVPAGGTVQNLLDSLNANVGGVGLYGQFSLDRNGTLTFAPTATGSATLSVVGDTTSSANGGASVSQLFGIGAAQQISRVNAYSVRSDIQANPLNLATAQVNLNAGTGEPVLAIGDGSGALAMAQAGSAQLNFAAAGGAGAITTSVNEYAAQFAGSLGALASSASTNSTNASAVQTEADSRRQSVEGVNLDQELINLTTYQQAYSSSARLITATKDMFTALQNM